MLMIELTLSKKGERPSEFMTYNELHGGPLLLQVIFRDGRQILASFSVWEKGRLVKICFRQVTQFRTDGDGEKDGGIEEGKTGLALDSKLEKF